ncbi:MAG: hypothetical protein LBV75_03140 [Paludibacter sp.]|jgi:hypothetical protein|nr:hypothetical protein [Paludibacter sp.]
MKAVRQISTWWNSEQIQILNQFGLTVKEGFNNIFIEENELYFKLEPYFKKWDVYNVRGFDYSKEERLNSKYCVIQGWNEGGYPQSENDNGYKKLTYNLDNYCPICGIGFKQKDAFRLKNIPKHLMFGLHWTFGELFFNVDVYKKIFEPLDIKCCDVKLYKSDKVIDSIIQLVLPEIEETVNLSDYVAETCSICRRTKYHPMVQGFFPEHKNPLPHIYKTKEYFGSGAQADKKIIISGTLRDILIKEKIMKYYWFIPCQ